MGNPVKAETLEKLARDAISSVESGYYDVSLEEINQESLETCVLTRPGEIVSRRRSMVHSILSRKNGAFVCEIKFASPSLGEISTKYAEVASIARQMELGGATALSVLTEPKNFNGSLANLIKARESTLLPIMMKDIIVSEEQIEASARIGASAVLLIEEIFSEGYSRKGLSLNKAVKFAKEHRLEVIVESNTSKGLIRAQESGCDILGINNRDLKTFRTNLRTTVDVLQEFSSMVRGEQLNRRIRSKNGTPIIMSESGFGNPRDILDLIEKLRSNGSIIPAAYLIGTSIMQSTDIEDTTRAFTKTLKAC